MDWKKAGIFGIFAIAGILIAYVSLGYFMIFLAVIVLLEIFSYLLINHLRKNFQWLITKKDENPKLDSASLEKFIEQGFDSELGWIRKPGTSKEEIGKFGKTSYHIDKKGSRENPFHEKFQSSISLYGDSFIFGRQVNDNETIQWFLSEFTKTNVLNFGVGNYGIDQALLRLKREFPKNKTKIVIMGVVPSTIVRILSVWKHYNEYGNTFGFKPRFFLKNGELCLFKNPITKKSEFQNYAKFIKTIRCHDYFYDAKFKKEMIVFPYLASILRQPLRNLPLIFTVIKNNFSKAERDKPYPAPMKIIMKINLLLRRDLYRKNSDAALLLEKIIEEFSDYARKNNSIPVFVMMPQKDDILFIKKSKNYFYRSLMDRVSGKLPTIDLTNKLMSCKNLDTIYSDDNQYGGHFSKYGSRFVAKSIFNDLRKWKII